MSILTLGSEKKGEGKFPIKEKEKENFQSKGKRKQGNSQSKSGRKKKRKGRKFPTKEWEKVKKKEEKKAPGQRNQKKCADRSLDQTISEQYEIVTK